jgi:hypothetical protein
MENEEKEDRDEPASGCDSVVGDNVDNRREEDSQAVDQAESATSEKQAEGAVAAAISDNDDGPDVDNRHDENSVEPVDDVVPLDGQEAGFGDESEDVIRDAAVVPYARLEVAPDVEIRLDDSFPDFLQALDIDAFDELHAREEDQEDHVARSLRAAILACVPDVEVAPRGLGMRRFDQEELPSMRDGSYAKDSFASLREEGTFCDGVLVSNDGKKFPIHRYSFVQYNFVISTYHSTVYYRDSCTILYFNFSFYHGSIKRFYIYH